MRSSRYNKRTTAIMLGARKFLLWCIRHQNLLLEVSYYDLVAQLVGASPPDVCITFRVRAPPWPPAFYQYISPRTASVRSLVLSIIHPHSPLVHGDGQSSVKTACQLFVKQKEREFALLTSRLGFILDIKTNWVTYFLLVKRNYSAAIKNNNIYQ